MSKAKAKDPITGLTEKEMKLCQEYINNGYNGTQAYLTVYGGTYATANARAHITLSKKESLEYIKSLQKNAFEQASINAERIALKLAEIAFASKDDEAYSPQAQLKALDLLQKQFSLQNQRISADVNSDITISVGIKKKEDTAEE